MASKKTILSLCVLCALAVSAMAAQSASAVTKGTTLFTCEPAQGGAGFSGEHCKESDAVPSGAKFKHVAIAENTTTNITGTTVDTENKPIVSKLKTVITGIETELQSALAHILFENNAEKSWVTNAVDPVTGEHYYHGEAWVKYTEVTVAKPGAPCKVKGGEVTTNKLKFTTKGQTEHTIKFEPAVGTVFAKFEVEGCTLEAINGVYEVKGSVKGKADGATLTFNHEETTVQNTLKVRNVKAGLDSTTTIKGTEVAPPKQDAVDTPLSPTTVETP